MDFCRLPNGILFQILQRLPFKERVRIACVNRRFKVVSKMAVSHTRALSLTAPIFRRVKSKQMSKLFRQSAANLKELICEVPHESQVQLRSTMLKRLRIFSKFPHPRLEVLKLDTDADFYDGTMIQKLLAGLPSLRRLEWKDRQTETLFTNFVVESLSYYCPNLKHVNLEAFMCYNEGIKALNAAFAKLPAVQTLELRPYCSDHDALEKIDSLWKLQSLRTLQLGMMCPVTDQLLEKISVAFPQLARLEINVGFMLTSQGFAVLKNMKYLRRITLIEWRYDKTDIFAMELISFECLEIVELTTEYSSTVTVSTFAHRCPKLRRLQFPYIQYVNSRKKARSFVRSLYGFVQEELMISITRAEAKVWECPRIRSAIAQINKSKNGRLISIRVGNQKRNVVLGPPINEWETDPECQLRNELIKKGIGRRLIDAIRDLLRKISKIFK